MNIREIYLDLDDVLNHLASHVVLNVSGTLDFNTPVGTLDFNTPVDYSWWDRRWGYCITSATNHIRAVNGKGEVQGDLWKFVDREMWRTIPKSTLCDWLVDNACRAVGIENVFILTKPTPHSGCWAGKADWVRENLGKTFLGQTILTSHKGKLGKPHRLLIDDFGKNVDAFLSEGGNAIMCPRPWNPLYDYEPVSYIRDRWYMYFDVPMSEFKEPEQQEAVEDEAI